MKVYDSTITLTGSCNASTTETDTKDWWGEFEVWLNKKGIANSSYVPMLESTVYIVSTHTKKDWVVFTPKVRKPPLKETLVCVRGCRTLTYLITK